MSAFDHLVQVDDKTREIRIYRIAADGTRDFYTSHLLPNTSGWSDELGDFARQLGENLLLDSPIARRLLKL